MMFQTLLAAWFALLLAAPTVGQGGGIHVFGKWPKNGLLGHLAFRIHLSDMPT